MSSLLQPNGPWSLAPSICILENYFPTIHERAEEFIRKANSDIAFQISLQIRRWQEYATLDYTHSSYFLTIFIGICLLVGLFHLKIFSFIDDSIAKISHGKPRIERLDALRAIAALFVVFHHAGYSSFYFFNKPGSWASWPGISSTIGDFGVCIFFMLSAFLFSSKSYLTNKSWTKFYSGRFFRLAPAAFFTAGICFFIFFYFSFFAPITVTSPDFKLSEWLPLFLNWTLAPFGQYPEAGQADINLINCGVMWTLRWEWLLYLMLPFLIFIRDKSNDLVIGTALITLSFTNDANNILYEALMCFGLGFIATFLHKQMLTTNKKILNSLALLFLILFFIQGETKAFYTHSLNIFCGGFFICIILGADLFGLFLLKSIQRIGEISFSLYLTHGIFIYLGGKLFSTDIFVYPRSLLFVFNHIYDINDRLVFCIFYNIIFLLSAIFACLLYYFIEFPSMKLGSNISSKIIE